jgi:hypothetical protein
MEYELGGEARIDFTPTGIVAVLEFPIDPPPPTRTARSGS